jgi:hypothetical protein
VLSGSLGGRSIALGLIVGIVGMLIAGWYVVSGADKKLVEELAAEKRGTRGKGELQSAMAAASPETRAMLERIREKLDAVEPAIERATMQGGSPAMLDGLRDDVTSVRHKVVAIANALPRLQIAKAKQDATRLEGEIARLTTELDEVTGALRDALAASKTSAEAELIRCREAIDLEQQMTELLKTIETETNQADKAVAGGKVAFADAERLRGRLAKTIATADSLLAAATKR